MDPALLALYLTQSSGDRFPAGQEDWCESAKEDREGTDPCGKHTHGHWQDQGECFVLVSNEISMLVLRLLDIYLTPNDSIHRYVRTSSVTFSKCLPVCWCLNMSYNLLSMYTGSVSPCQFPECVPHLYQFKNCLHGWGQLKRIGIDQLNSGIGSGIERFGTNCIGIEHFWIDLELKDIELELNEKELSIWYFCGVAQDILQTVGSIAVQAWQWCLMTKNSCTINLPFKHYPAINQLMKLMNGKSIMLFLLPFVNECWLGTASEKHWNCPDNNHIFLVSHAKQSYVNGFFNVCVYANNTSDIWVTVSNL